MTLVKTSFSLSVSIVKLIKLTLDAKSTDIAGRVY